MLPLLFAMLLTKGHAQPLKVTTYTLDVPKAQDVTAVDWGEEPIAFVYEEASERAECSDVDLRPTMAERGLPARRHQTNTGWCYAFVAADLLSFKTGHNLSPADVARHHMNARAGDFTPGRPGIASSYPFGGGFSARAIEDAQAAGGICLESDFPSEPYGYLPPEPLPGQPKPPAQPPLPIDLEALAGVFRLPHLAELVQLVQQNDFRYILTQLAGRSCTPVPLDGVEVRAPDLNSTNRAGLNQELDARLSQGVPVGIDYDAEVLYRPPTTDMLQTVTTWHASSVVGRRFNPDRGRCEYLVRNTEGSCDGYQDDFECENNHVWVPRQVLRVGIGGLVSVP